MGRPYFLFCLLLCGAAHAQDTLHAQVARWTSGLILRGRTADRTMLDFRSDSIGAGQRLRVRVVSDELIVIKEGSVTVLYNGAIKHLGPGGTFLCLAGDEAGFASETRTVFYRLSILPAQRQQGAAPGKSVLLDWSELPVTTNPRGEVRPVFSEPTAALNKIDMHATTLNAGEMPHPAHTHPQAELILILSGNLTMQIGSTFYPAQTGDIALFTSMTPHGVKNTGDTAARYFALQWE